MENAEVDIQLDAHPGPPCASRSSEGAYVPLGPVPSEYRIWCTVMMNTDTNRRWRQAPRWVRAFACRTALSHRPTDACSLPISAGHELRCNASRQATDEANQQLHAPAAVGLSTAGPRRACGPVGMARFTGAPRAECPSMDNPRGVLPCAQERPRSVPPTRDRPRRHRRGNLSHTILTPLTAARSGVVRRADPADMHHGKC